jgi:AraC family transcriptional regulator, regulatory protein of adaptative response / DNA-3-methyladenine glycosylase II
MVLDLQTCSRARLSRDPRFDGKFFIAVLTSRVYCRPICPARTAMEKNVRYYASAAAAEEAGFRPCLRCRPECSPGTPAWLGTPSTVSRALRLIHESGLEDGGVETLAERLGIGSRHLRRLFLQHLGASPSAVAQTRRLQFAKKLIDETTLPMNQIAVAAGFGTVRRFNAGVQKVYRRTPTQIRKLSRAAGQEEDHYVFRLRYRPPYHWHGLLKYLDARATPGVESVQHGSYARTMCLNGQPGHFTVALDDSTPALKLTLRFADPCALFVIIERIRNMFDLNADWTAIVNGLSGDRELARSLRASPGLRVPGCWDPFELSVRAILGQQITVKGATMLAGRLAKKYGLTYSGNNRLAHLFPTAKVLAGEHLDGIGLTRARAETIRRFSAAVRDGEIKFDGGQEAHHFIAQMRKVPGIGEWTAQYVAMRAMGEPDALPYGDRGLLRALNYEHASELEGRAEAWRPWRAYAAMCLWSSPPKGQTSEAFRADADVTTAEEARL